jgi:succinate dehydrogenase / fumarate reductase cytochrome b subunit
MLSRNSGPRINRNTPWWPANYQAGTWAFALHRVSGLLLAVYLFVHLWVISFATVAWGGVSFDRLMGFFDAPLVKVLELGLVILVVFHGLNGVRILLFDAGVGVRQQKQLFWIVLATTLFLGIAASILTITHLTPSK